MIPNDHLQRSLRGHGATHRQGDEQSLLFEVMLSCGNEQGLVQRISERFNVMFATTGEDWMMASRRSWRMPRHAFNKHCVSVHWVEPFASPCRVPEPRELSFFIQLLHHELPDARPRAPDSAATRPGKRRNTRSKQNQYPKQNRTQCRSLFQMEGGWEWSRISPPSTISSVHEF